MCIRDREEVERLCDRVLLLKDGRARAYGTVSDVRSQFGGTRIHVDTDGAVPPSDAYTIITVEPGHTELEVNNDADTSAILASLVSAGRCLLYTSPSPRDGLLSRMPSSA